MSGRAVALSTGITMNVAVAGPADAPPVILLHGFPESHRTWAKVAPLLGDRFRLVMPDLRGFGDSDRPQDVAAYATDTLIADLFALADALGVDRFALVGHDWGGAVAWAAAMRGDPRIERLAIVNSPHPAIFQRSIIEDDAQRAASQYIRAFRDPGMEAAVAAMGVERFFDKSFARPCRPCGDRPRRSRPEHRRVEPPRRADRDVQLVSRLARSSCRQWARPSPCPNGSARRAEAQASRCAIIWGLDDKALLPVQLEGIGEVGDDVEVVPLAGRRPFRAVAGARPGRGRAAALPWRGASRYRRAI